MGSNNVREDVIDLDLHELHDSAEGLDSILNEVEPPQGEIEERIRQLEAVTLRARQRLRWRQGLQNSPQPLIICPGPSVSNSHNGDTMEAQKTTKKDGIHLVAEALRTDSSSNNSGRNDNSNRRRNGNASFYDCNVCWNIARDPILTCCGHLFCWACFYQVPYAHSNAKDCPVCGGEVTDTNIIPIYGSGNSNKSHESKLKKSCLKVPPRPLAQRIETSRQNIISRGASSPMIEERIRQLSNIVGATRERLSGLDNVPQGLIERVNSIENRALNVIRQETSSIPIEARTSLTSNIVATSTSEQPSVQDFHATQGVTERANFLSRSQGRSVMYHTEMMLHEYLLSRAELAIGPFIRNVPPIAGNINPVVIPPSSPLRRMHIDADVGSSGNQTNDIVETNSTVMPSSSTRRRYDSPGDSDPEVLRVHRRRRFR